MNLSGKSKQWSGAAVLLTCLLCFGGWAHGDQPKSIEEQSTHADVGKIPVQGIQAFAIDPDGNILAACHSGDTGIIRILDAEGEQQREWQVDFKPEAINSTPEGDILVGGVGQLRRFDNQGQLLKKAESPHIAGLQTKKQEMRQDVINRLKQQMNRTVSYKATLEQYTEMLDTLKEKEKKGTLGDQESQILKVLPQHIERIEALVKEENKNSQGKEKPQEPTEEQIQSTLKSTIASKSRVASISTDGQRVFVATPSAVGYGYSVWKMDQDFQGGTEIVTGLRGCCGQMDVQCCENGIYVAENARFRVICYDTEGQERVSWGKGDRTGLDGFTSCCNPANVCFNAQGDVYTSESTTGRIKRFDKDGKFLNFVGDVKLVPGCKNVSIAVSPDTSRVYMLDMTRGHIVKMQELDEETRAERAKQAAEAKEREVKRSTNPVVGAFQRFFSTPQ